MTDMVDRIADILIQDHINLMKENERLRAEAERLTRERDTAWQELREIRSAIEANPEESTADEARRVRAEVERLGNSNRRLREDIDRLTATGLKHLYELEMKIRTLESATCPT